MLLWKFQPWAPSLIGRSSKEKIFKIFAAHVGPARGVQGLVGLLVGVPLLPWFSFFSFCLLFLSFPSCLFGLKVVFKFFRFLDSSFNLNFKFPKKKRKDFLQQKWAFPMGCHTLRFTPKVDPTWMPISLFLQFFLKFFIMRAPNFWISCKRNEIKLKRKIFI